MNWTPRNGLSASVRGGGAVAPVGRKARSFRPCLSLNITTSGPHFSRQMAPTSITVLNVQAHKLSYQSHQRPLNPPCKKQRR